MEEQYIKWLLIMIAKWNSLLKGCTALNTNCWRVGYLTRGQLTSFFIQQGSYVPMHLKWTCKKIWQWFFCWQYPAWKWFPCREQLCAERPFLKQCIFQILQGLDSVEWSSHSFVTLLPSTLPLPLHPPFSFSNSRSRKRNDSSWHAVGGKRGPHLVGTSGSRKTWVFPAFGHRNACLSRFFSQEIAILLLSLSVLKFCIAKS